MAFLGSRVTDGSQIRWNLAATPQFSAGGRALLALLALSSFYAGYFEELTPEQIERQLATSLDGPMNVTRAVLPVMRRQRYGHVIAISSGSGLLGFEFCSAYAASKFGLEGWMESLQPEVAPFGIHTTVVNPGFFRTELLTQESVTYAEPSIDDYAKRRAGQLDWWKAQSGQQPGDPAKLAKALITIANAEQPPRRFIAGADCRLPRHLHVARHRPRARRGDQSPDRVVKRRRPWGAANTYSTLRVARNITGYRSKEGTDDCLER
jgi:NAD(P)-dependent dehydrogenase (short-subunit alcohol dehydrogenase family)